jgi:hypothetical protein
MNVYEIDQIAAIAASIKSGEPLENDIGTVIDGFFWFPDEMKWAAEWQKTQEQESPNGYFAMLLNPDIFDDEEDEEEIMAGIEYWWHRSQIYSAAYLINKELPKNETHEDLAKKSLAELLEMQKSVKVAFQDEGMETGKKAEPKDIWKVVRTTAQYIHNNVRGVH